jgi:hypothetical protein
VCCVNGILKIYNIEMLGMGMGLGTRQVDFLFELQLIFYLNSLSQFEE